MKYGISLFTPNKRMRSYGYALSSLILLFSSFTSLALTSQGDSDAILSGDFDVSGGQAKYSLPISVPVGRAGFKPDLSFEYQSDNPNDMLGVGWDITGLSSISRCRKNLAIDGSWGGVNFDNDDRYCLDGERLIAVSGDDGKNGTEYRLEKNGYSKIISYSQAGNGPEYFKIWTKDGSILEYGVTTDSRAEAPKQPRRYVYKWAINKKTDITRNNHITYAYTETNGEHYVNQISYVGGSIKFLYENRSDHINRYLNGSLLAKRKRLIDVEIKDSTGTKIGWYDLDYQDSNGTQSSLLNRIRYCTNNSCSTPVEFNWQMREYVKLEDNKVSNNIPEPRFYNLNQDGYATAYGRLGSTKDSLKVIDLKGKVLSKGWFSLKGPINEPSVEIGKCGRINSTFSYMPEPDGLLVTACEKPDGDVKSYAADFTGTGVSTVFRNDYSVADINNDGKDDLVRTAKQHTEFKLTGSNTGFERLYPSKPNRLYSLVDMNNDGYLDAIFTTNFYYESDTTVCPTCMPLLESGTKVHLALFDGKKFLQPSLLLSVKKSSIDGLKFIDINNDGYPDAYYNGSFYRNHSGTIYSGYPDESDFDSIALMTSYEMTDNESDPSFLDINSDGWPDAVIKRDQYMFHPPRWAGSKIQYSLPFAQDRINKIEEYGVKYDITYKVLRDAQSSQSYYHYPVTNSTPNMYVVSDVIKSPKGYQSTTYEYQYEGARSHLRGHGFLGFSNIIETEYADVMTKTTTGYYSINNRAYSANDLYQVGNPTYKSVVKNGKEISETLFTYHVNEREGTKAKYYQVYANKIINFTDQVGFEIDGTEKKEEVSIVQDQFGNITSETKVLSGLNQFRVIPEFRFEKLVKFKSTTIPTNNDDFWKLSAPETISNTITDLKSGLKRQVTNNLAYYQSGNQRGLLAHNITSGNAYEDGPDGKFLKYAYQYDAFGNQIQEVVSGTDLYARQKWVNYDGKGLFPTELKNHKGHITSVNYDAKTGKLYRSTSPNKGRVTTFNYDTYQRLRTVVNPGGNITSYSYKLSDCSFPHPQMTRCVVTENAGKVVKTQYDYADREVRQLTQDFNGKWVHQDTTWDRNGRKLSVTRPAYVSQIGKVVPTVRFLYDERNREIRKQEPAANGGIATFTTEYFGLTTKITDARGYIERTEQNVLGHILRKTEELGAYQSYSYYPDGKLKTATDAKGNKTTIGYDNLGYRSALDDPDMGKWTYTYNVLGQLIQKADANDVVTTISYDRLGRKEQEKSGSQVSTWKYDENGALGLLASHANGDSETHYTYNALGLTDSVTMTVGGENFTTRYTYDKYERVIREIRPNGKTADNQPESLALEYIYNPFGYKSAVRSPKAYADYVFTSADFRDEINLLIKQAIAQAERYLVEAERNLTKAEDYKQQEQFLIDKAAEFSQDMTIRHSLDRSSQAMLTGGGVYRQWCTDDGECYFRPEVWALIPGAVSIPIAVTSGDADKIYQLETISGWSNAGVRRFNSSIHKVSEDVFSSKPLTREHDFYLHQGDALISKEDIYIAQADRATQKKLASISEDVPLAASIASSRYRHYTDLADELLNLVEEVAELGLVEKYTDLGQPYCENVNQLAGKHIRAAKRDHCQNGNQTSQVDLLKNILTNSELAESQKDGSYIYYWQRRDTDAYNHTLTEILGNGLANTYQHNTNTGLLDTISTHAASNLFDEKYDGKTDVGRNIRLLKYTYDNHNNVTIREDIELGITDVFTYDALDRLDDNRVILDTPYRHGQNNADFNTRFDFNYDSLGNIKYKTGIGDYKYGGVNNAGPHAVTQANGQIYTYDAVGNLIQATTTDKEATVERSLEWTTFNKPSRITRGTNTVEFFYDANHSRYKKISSDGSETIYFGKVYEQVKNTDTGDIQHKQFIYADGKLIALNTQTKDSANKLKNKQISYLHYDALNSVDMITDGYGNIVERRSFDAWGKKRNVIWRKKGDVRDLTLDLLTNRGFTGHEHIDEVGLIHMNGRVYDQRLGRFLSADPVIQAPFLTNSFNRYSYVMNNPLKYTDPTGFSARELGWADDYTYTDFMGRNVYGGWGDNGSNSTSVEFSSVYSVSESPDDNKVDTSSSHVSGQSVGTQSKEVDKENQQNALTFWASWNPVVGFAQSAADISNALNTMSGVQLAVTIGFAVIDGVVPGPKVLGDVGKRFVKNVDVENNAKAIKNARQRGVNRAKSAERDLVKSGHPGTADNAGWSFSERKRIAETGQFPSDTRWHHINDVKRNPGQADVADNVIPSRGGNAGHVSKYHPNGTQAGSSGPLMNRSQLKNNHMNGN